MKRPTPAARGGGGFFFRNEIVLRRDVGVLNNVLFINTEICIGNTILILGAYDSFIQKTNFKMSKK
jgi:hypothetical protein